MHRLSVKNLQSQDGFLLLPSVLLVWVPKVTAIGQLSSQLPWPPEDNMVCINKSSTQSLLTGADTMSQWERKTGVCFSGHRTPRALCRPCSLRFSTLWCGPRRLGREEGESVPPLNLESQHRHRVLLGIPHSTAEQGLELPNPTLGKPGDKKSKESMHNSCSCLPPSASARPAFKQAVLLFPWELGNCWCGPSCICNLMEIGMRRKEVTKTGWLLDT